MSKKRTDSCTCIAAVVIDAVWHVNLLALSRNQIRANFVFARPLPIMRMLLAHTLRKKWYKICHWGSTLLTSTNMYNLGVSFGKDTAPVTDFYFFYAERGHVPEKFPQAV